MWDLLWLSLVLNLLVGISSSNVQTTATTKDENTTFPIVKIPQGALRGITLTSRYNRSFSAFKGIPYAEPPVGNLRFSSPVPANAWNGTLNASVDGNSCPQPNNIGEEDCLYLNVYTPQLPVESGNASSLPVMVWIHGGKFEIGEGSSDSFGPGFLLDENIVLVSINYRLGPLGFLSTGDEVAPGNWGLKDQVLALRWVQNNIAYFGGDPNRVTIFGQSAGAASVQLLALSDSTIGLFHKFISQSGTAYGFWPHRPRSSITNLTLKLGEILSCPTNTSSLLVDCLRKFDASEIINTRTRLLKWYKYPLVAWSPTDEPDIEGAFLTDTPANLIAAGKIRDVPSMTGIVINEGFAFVPGVLRDSEIFQEFIDNIDELLPVVLQYWDQVGDVTRLTVTLKEFYFNNNLATNRTQVWFNAEHICSDSFFTYPVYRVLQKQLAFAKSDSFFYSFEYRGTHSYAERFNESHLPNTTVVHSDDLLYLFPRLESPFGVLPEEMSEKDRHMVDTMVQLWTSFAINGTPTTTAKISNVTWLPYSSEKNYLKIGSGSDPTLELRYNFLQERMQVWDRSNPTGSGNITIISPLLRLFCILIIAYEKFSTLIGN